MKRSTQGKFPGERAAMDGSAAVVRCEREASDATALPPSGEGTRMGALWAAEVARGHLNASGRALRRIELESEAAALSGITGLALTGLRTTGFIGGPGLTSLHEALFALAGKRIPTVLHVAARAATKSAASALAGHDGYHAVADTGCFQLFARDVQAAADLTFIAHRIAEGALAPGLLAQDAHLTTDRIACVQIPERALVAEYLGRTADLIDSPTPAQRMLFGPRRRRVPELWSVDNPVLSGGTKNADAYAQSVAAERPYHFDHLAAICDAAMDLFTRMTGRRYARVGATHAEDADYLIVGQGSVVPTAEAVADHLRRKRRIKAGVLDVTLLRPFPGDLLGRWLKGRKGVVVLERLDQPLAEDLPLMREIRAALGKCLENGRVKRGDLPYPGYETYKRIDDAPPLYAASYGLGGRDLQPEGVIGAVENMLPKGARRTRAALSVDFLREASASPKQEIFQQALRDAYPGIAKLALRGSENPDLLPKECLTVRIHAVAGREIFTPEDNLARTLFELRGYHVQATAGPPGQARGQPVTFQLAAAPEPIRVQSDLRAFDAVIATDPRVFHHTDPLAGLKATGALILQSDRKMPENIWATIPPAFQKAIRERDIQLYAVDALGIAREEARDPESRLRIAGRVFEGAFFRTPFFVAATRLATKELNRALRQMLVQRIGDPASEAVEEELRVIQRGMKGLLGVPALSVAEALPAPRPSPLPAVLKDRPLHPSPAWDLHHFWEETANFYAAGQGGEGLAEPFIASGLIPAASGIFRDLSPSRAEHPRWIPEKCTGCGACWTVCPDSALPGLVNGIGEILQTALAQVEAAGQPAERLPRAVRVLEGKIRARVAKGTETETLAAHLPEAITQTLAASKLTAEGAKALEEEFVHFQEAIGDFPFALTQPFFRDMEKKARGSGGLLSITVDPAKCKGCMACVEACEDEALEAAPQTPGSLAALRRRWEFWRRLPTTDAQHIRLDAGPDDKPGRETLLLDKRAYHTLVGGDHGDPGAGDRTALHLFAATVEAVMRPRIAAHLARIEDLIERLERHIRMRLAVDVEDTEALQQAMAALQGREFTLSDLSGQLDRDRSPIDAEWLDRVAGILTGLKRLRDLYRRGPEAGGRASLGVVSGGTFDAAWAATYPYNPFPFPWTRHLFQEGPALAMGIFEGHMAKMAEGFQVIRLADLELQGRYSAEEHRPFFSRFDWRHFNDEEALLCPPVVVVGGDSALAGAGLQDLSTLLRSGTPIKVLCLDRQSYRHAAGLAAAEEGPGSRRQDLTLQGLADRAAYVAASSLANVPQMLESFMEGLAKRRTALFSVYCPSLPADGGADDRAVDQSRLALESRAHPLFRFDPDRGATPEVCLDLTGNPAPDALWPTYTLTYRDAEGKAQSMDVPMTFADFAVTVPELQHHFRAVPAEAGRQDWVPVADYLDRDAEGRAEVVPFIWAVDGLGRRKRLAVSQALVRACEERRDTWKLLRALTRRDIVPVDEDAIADRARGEVVTRVSQNLLELATSATPLPDALVQMAAPPGGSSAEKGGKKQREPSAS
jgi:pyruvate-ferredoxin/flavodoxin oxidoreductase